MDSVFYVIAIMGCGDGQVQCAQQRIETVRYASAAQCRAAMPAALMRNTDVDFPTITAACRQVGQSMADRVGRDRRG
ncbi:hypothetical protein [Sphingomonas bacterium]|uniref:hypothetical protein n=1 Tax=Sphingomonas bacterium TaxID=1895847 RepID=UPI002603FB58|nr:hypothetical protein [Sphingomonas bacterium]MDB5677701.1 hypothetical protein [Sphingomonas bacterium]